MSTEKRTVIGTVNLNYNEDGTLSTASFYPSIKVSRNDIFKELGDCTNKTVYEVKKCAELLLGSFFSKISEIELRDVETTKIEAEIVHEEKFTTGGLKDIEFEFIYKQK